MSSKTKWHPTRGLLLFSVVFGLIGSGPISVLIAGDIPSPIPSYAREQVSREDATLRSVAFNRDGVGIACGDRGVIVRSSDAGATWEIVESGTDCSLSSVQWTAANRAVIVGGAYDRITGISRGLALTSADGGETWTRSPDQELPRLTQLEYSGELLIAHGDWSHPLLTNRFESRNRGQTWQAGNSNRTPPFRLPGAGELHRWTQATGVPVATRHATKISDDAICAVGDHGVILVSRDRGQTWSATRGGERQTAILIVSRHGKRVPWSLLGNETLESRSRVALLLQDSEINHSPSVSQGDEVSDRQLIDESFGKVMQVATALGASGADEIGSLDETPDRVARQWIDIHRPAVLVLDDQLDTALSDALFQAATEAGVGRVVRYTTRETEESSRGPVAHSSQTVLHHEAVLARCGILAGDLQADAMHWIDPFHSGSVAIHVHSLYEASSHLQRGDSLVSGLPITPSHQLSSPGSPASRRKLQVAQARMNQSQRIAKLIDGSRTASQFAANMSGALDLTAPEDQFRLAWSLVLATKQHSSSFHAVALHEAALQEFAERFPEASAGRWALIRADVMANSLEWTRLRSSLRESLASVTRIPVAEPVVVSPFQVDDQGVRTASAISPVVVPKPEMIDLNKPKRKSEPEVDLYWEFNPLVLFAREAAKQRSDEETLQTAGEQSTNLTRLRDSDHPWSEVLRKSGRNTILAFPAAARPRLDGSLDEPCWKISAPGPGLMNQVRVAYDQDYVYFAIQCRADEVDSDPLVDRSSVGVRDQDLTSSDRITFWIDLDRDLMSAMQLQVTDAGRVHDAIDGHADWQPTWYPAIRRDADSVTAEIAILRRDLVDLPIVAQESWLLQAGPVAAGQLLQAEIEPNPRKWVRVVFQP